MDNLLIEINKGNFNFIYKLKHNNEVNNFSIESKNDENVRINVEIFTNYNNKVNDIIIKRYDNKLNLIDLNLYLTKIFYNNELYLKLNCNIFNDNILLENANTFYFVGGVTSESIENNTLNLLNLNNASGTNYMQNIFVGNQFIQRDYFKLKFNQTISPEFNGENYIYDKILSESNLIIFYKQFYDKFNNGDRFQFGNSDVIIFNKFDEVKKIIKVSANKDTFYLNFKSKEWIRMKFNFNEFQFFGLSTLDKTTDTDLHSKFGLLSVTDYNKIINGKILQKTNDVINFQTTTQDVNAQLKIGYNLDEDSKTSILIGKFNKFVNNCQLIIGLGKNNENRSNLLYIKDYIINGLKGINIISEGDELLMTNNKTIKVENLRKEIITQKNIKITGVNFSTKIDNSIIPYVSFHFKNKINHDLIPISDSQINYIFTNKADGRYLKITKIPQYDNMIFDIILIINN